MASIVVIEAASSSSDNNDSNDSGERKIVNHIDRPRMFTRSHEKHVGSDVSLKKLIET
jgi:hypothetical protein